MKILLLGLLAVSLNSQAAELPLDQKFTRCSVWAVMSVNVEKLKLFHNALSASSITPGSKVFNIGYAQGQAYGFYIGNSKKRASAFYKLKCRELESIAQAAINNAST